MKNFLILLFLLTIYEKSKSESIQPSAFCSEINCQCDTEKKLVTCSKLNSTSNINSTKYWWNDKNETFPFYKVSIQEASLTHITPFPKSVLQILDLSKNNIEIIDDDTFKYLQNMTELNLNDNDLTSEVFKPDIFRGLYAQDAYLPLRSLKVLRLANNDLHTLHQDIFEHIMNLEILDLHGNPLRVLDTSITIAISGLLYLKNLDLSYTFIKKLPSGILHAPKYLTQLDLRGNYFTYIPTSELEHAKQLQYLNFNENPIGNITKERGFPNMPNLRILHLCYLGNLNKIEDGSLSGLINLKQLYITNNPKLNYIGSMALAKKEEDTENHDWPKLDKLHLNNNHLSHLPSTLLSDWTELSEINLNNNPWSCDCDNQWMLDELMEIIYTKPHIPEKNNTPKQVKVNESEVISLYCASPVEMEGQNLVDLWRKKEDLRCLDLYGARPERDAGILVGMLIGLLTGIPLVLGAIFCYKKKFFGYFNEGPAAYSRRFYNPATTDDDLYS